MDKLLNLIASVMGASLWAPSLAVFVVGNGTGVQLPLIVSCICLFFFVISRRFKVPAKALLYVGAWVSVMLFGVMFSADPGKSMMGTIYYSAGVIVFLSACFLAKRPQRVEGFLNGFILGGTISSLYAVYQAFAFPLGLPLATLLNNNPSFPSFARSPYLYNFPRGFGFTPEPSVFTSLLVPALMILIYRLVAEKNTKMLGPLVIMLLGLMASASMAVVFTLPLALSLLLLANPPLRRKFLRLGVALCVIGCIALIYYVASPSASSNALVARIENLGQDSSLGIRRASQLAAVKVFLDHPLTGTGIMASGQAYLKHMPWWVYQFEDKNGVDSWPLAIAAEQGVFALVSYLALATHAYKSARYMPAVRAGLIGVLVTSFFQTGYLSLYHIWAFLGVSAGLVGASGSPDKKSEEFGSPTTGPVSSTT